MFGKSLNGKADALLHSKLWPLNYAKNFSAFNTFWMFHVLFYYFPFKDCHFLDASVLELCAWLLKHFSGTCFYFSLWALVLNFLGVIMGSIDTSLFLIAARITEVLIVHIELGKRRMFLHILSWDKMKITFHKIQNPSLFAEFPLDSNLNNL